MERGTSGRSTATRRGVVLACASRARWDDTNRVDAEEGRARLDIDPGTRDEPTRVRPLPRVESDRWMARVESERWMVRVESERWMVRVESDRVMVRVESERGRPPPLVRLPLPATGNPRVSMCASVADLLIPPVDDT